MRLGEVELDGPPAFEPGQKVRVRKMIRNDGTFPGIDVGQALVKKGEVGYIVNIGTFLQTSYVYSVHFMAINRVIGCLKKELELLEDFSAQSEDEE